MYNYILAIQQNLQSTSFYLYMYIEMYYKNNKFRQTD